MSWERRIIERASPRILSELGRRRLLSAHEFLGRTERTVGELHAVLWPDLSTTNANRHLLRLVKYAFAAGLILKVTGAKSAGKCRTVTLRAKPPTAKEMGCEDLFAEAQE